MLGQSFSEQPEKFNVIVLAGGSGRRMGSASDHIPKGLTKLGSQRAIDLILSKFMLIGQRFVIGIAWHADLLESYVRGNFPNLDIAFSREASADLRSNAHSLMYALDSIDSRLGTIVSFCDLLLISNPLIMGSSLYLATKKTEGVVGTFRHSVELMGEVVRRVLNHPKPRPIAQLRNGVIGFFVLENTLLLKEITYTLARAGKLNDITSDIIAQCSDRADKGNCR